MLWERDDILLDNHPMMYRRPDNVTGAGLIICICAVWSGLSSLLGLSSDEGLGSTFDVANKIVQGGAGLALLVAGVNILRGENWARWFYLAICCGLFAYDLAFLKDELHALVPYAVVQFIAIALLFAPSANKYYGSAMGRWD